IVKNDPYKQMLFNWLDSTQRYYTNTMNFDSLRPLQQQLNNQLAEIQVFSDSIAPFIKSHITSNATGVVYNFAVADADSQNHIAVRANFLATRIHETFGKIDKFANSPATKPWIMRWLW